MRIITHESQHPSKTNVGRNEETDEDWGVLVANRRTDAGQQLQQKTCLPVAASSDSHWQCLSVLYLWLRGPHDLSHVCHMSCFPHPAGPYPAQPCCTVSTCERSVNLLIHDTHSARKKLCVQNSHARSSISRPGLLSCTSGSLRARYRRCIRADRGKKRPSSQ